MAEKIYLISDNEELWNNEMLFTCKEKAREIGKKIYGDVFFIGERVEYTPWVDWDIAEEIASTAWDNCGEVAEGYLGNLTKEESDELDELVNDIVLEWLKANDKMPDFWVMMNVEMIIGI